jgi:MarR family 2-MHQ and catechol resistance regulon transcriptional repressor
MVGSVLMIKRNVLNRKNRRVKEIDNKCRAKVDRGFSLWLMIAHTRDVIHLLRKRELGEYGITPQQAGILRRIKQLDNNATAAELARWQFRKPNTMTIILRRMIQKGLIVKRNDKYRKNLQRISLTKKGEEVFQRATKRESIKNIMSELSEEQLEKLWTFLKIILETGSKQLKTKVNIIDYILYTEE